MSRPHEKIEVVHRVATEAEGAMIVAALDNAGIDAQMEGALTSALRAEAPGEVGILVRASDASAARRVIDAISGED